MSAEKFRCSDHKLEIETGRHRNLEVEERTCQICKNATESQLHFLQGCELYADLRSRYFGNTHLTNISDILQCKDKNMAFNFANFLTKAFKLRKNILDLQIPTD